MRGRSGAIASFALLALAPSSGAESVPTPEGALGPDWMRAYYIDYLTGGTATRRAVDGIDRAAARAAGRAWLPPDQPGGRMWPHHSAGAIWRSTISSVTGGTAGWFVPLPDGGEMDYEGWLAARSAPPPRVPQATVSCDQFGTNCVPAGAPSARVDPRAEWMKQQLEQQPHNAGPQH